MIDVIEGQITMDGEIEGRCTMIRDEWGNRCGHLTSEHELDESYRTVIGEEIRPCSVRGCGCDDFRAPA
jgi:hypothetical protein